MRHLIHDAPEYRLEAVISHHPISGHTVELFTTWPKANHPEPHKVLSLTLPPESFARLAQVLEQEVRQ
jgi:hypothetical protein